MKAAQITSQYKVDLVQLDDIRSLSDDDVLIKINILGLCGSDLTTYRGMNPLVSFPRIPGHEIAGEIVNTGKNTTGNLIPHQKVTIWPYSFCGICPSCRQGKINCCRENKTYGVQRDGAAIEYLAVPAKFVIPVPELQDELISLIEPLSVGWHSTERGKVEEGVYTAVFGCGLIGLGAIAAAAQKGAEVIAIDIDDEKLSRAESIGAKHTINIKSENLEHRINQITKNDGCSVVIEAVGAAVTFRNAVSIASYSGRVVYIGYTKEEVCYETKDFVRKEIEIYGSRNALLPEFNLVKSMIIKNPKVFKELITSEYDFLDAAKAFKYWHENTNKVTKIILRM